MRTPFKPTREQIISARDKSVPDIIAPNLCVLFCGINPGLYTAAVGHHFARPGNRFWPALHRAGFTPRLVSPFEEEELTAYGYGITNLVNRATAGAAELSPKEIIEGGRILEEKVRRYAPRFLAVLGVGAYRTAFRRPGAAVGQREEFIGGSRVWVLPNPSGANAHYQMDELVGLFRQLRSAAETDCG